jgi:hypothetical protein
MTIQQIIDASVLRCEQEMKRIIESHRRSIGQLFRHVNKKEKTA